MSDLLLTWLTAFDWFVLAYFLVLNTSYLLLVLTAASDTTRALRRPLGASHDDIFANPLTPPISVVVGAHDEEACIVESVRSILSLRYPHFEVVVVDDGSTDGTFAVLAEAFDLREIPCDIDLDVPVVGEVRSMHEPARGEPLLVVRKANGGKADALNVGLNCARHPLVSCVDADSILEGDALLQVAKPFVDDPDRVVASGGVIRAANGSTVYRGQISGAQLPRNWWARIQIMEYLRSFLLGRTGWSRLGGLLIISGAFGLYRRDLLVEIGGFDATSVGEDAEAVVAMHRLMRERRQPYRVVYVPEPVCWTEVPTTRAVLSRQRTRWSQGLAQVMWKHRRMIGNPRYGRIGLAAMPFYVAFELLGPVIELVGFVAVIAGLHLGAVDTPFALVFFLVAFLYGIALSIVALLVEEVSFHKYDRWRDVAVAVVASVLENVGYRQLHAWWRLRGLVCAVRRREASWGVMTRAGFGTEAAKP